jgi:hypothetical protein
MARVALGIALAAALAAPLGAEEAGHGHHAHRGHHHDAADAGHGGAHAASAEARANLARATAALDRFQDVAEAERAGYVKPGRNDGFQMGEHW